MGRLFGTDGVRGVAGRELTGELAYSLGAAAVRVLGRHGEDHPVVVVGRDTRASGDFLEAALAAGICSAGGDVLLSGHHAEIGAWRRARSQELSAGYPGPQGGHGSSPR